MKPSLVFGAALSVLLLIGCAQKDSDTGSLSTDNMQDDSINLTGDFRGPLGLQLWSVRVAAADDVAGTLKKVHDMGFREVELAGTYDMPAETFRTMLDESGLEATAMHAGYERFRDSLDVVLDEAEVLGAKLVGLAWIPHDGAKPFTDANSRAAAADFNKWGAAAKARGLTFFYHVHGYEFRMGADGQTPFDVLAAETDPDVVKFEMDVFWVTRPGVDPAELLRKYPDRWQLMHIKDMKKGTATDDHSGGAPEEADVPIGTGLIDYPSVLSAAAEIGLDRYYIEDESADPLDNIPVSVSFLETVTF